jgi:hypothetical protein
MADSRTAGMQNGDRGGSTMELMRSVVQKLDNDDMLAIAAYAASLQPVTDGMPVTFGLHLSSERTTRFVHVLQKLDVPSDFC